MRARLLTATVAVSLIAASAACASGPSTPPSASTSATSPLNSSSPLPMKITDPYSPTIEPSAFTTTIGNPYFLLTPGTRTIYEAATKDGLQRTVDTAGSFEGGVDGAMPGIIMPGHPQIGDQYRQEYAKGVAEDTGEVLSLSGSETTPLTGPAKDLLVTKDADLLDSTAPGENKYYARGVGLILTVTTTDPAERDQAIVVEKF